MHAMVREAQGVEVGELAHAHAQGQQLQGQGAGEEGQQVVAGPGQGDEDGCARARPWWAVRLREMASLRAWSGSATT